MITVAGKGHGEQSSNLDEAVCNSDSTTTLGKGMNLAMGK